MKVLITGGTGFLGSSLSRRHLAQGDEVVAIGLENTPLEAANCAALRQEGVDVRVGDFSDPEVLSPALPGAELVYHIAAAMREANVPDEHFWEVNVHATRRLAEACRDQGVRRLVYCGTAGAIGTDRGFRTDEETEGKPRDIYQTTKLAAERALLEFHAESGFPVAIVRPPAVYGPADGRLLKLFRMIAKGWFVLPGGGGRHHLVFVEDLMDGMQLAATKEEAVGRIFNIAHEESVPLEELVRVLADGLGVSCRLVRVPIWPLDALAATCETVCRPLKVQPPLYRRRLDFYRHDEEFSIDRATAELGFRPRHSLAEGVAETIAGYRAQGLLE